MKKYDTAHGGQEIQISINVAVSVDQIAKNGDQVKLCETTAQERRPSGVM